MSGMSRLPAVLVLPLVFAITLLVGAVPASPASPAPRADEARGVVASPQSTYRSSAVRATNGARARYDLRALDTDRCLQRFAARQAVAMARQESMYHQDLGPVMRTCGLGLAGENVAYGYPSGREVVRGWMHSPGHRANILNRGYRLVAVAARESASGRWYAAQVFGSR